MTVGLNLNAIVEALADQIRAGIQRDINVSPDPNSGMPLPCIEIWPGTPYVDYFGTLGPNGNADVQLKIKIEVDSIDATTIRLQMNDYLSAGTGNSSSIPDAVMRDRSIGGVLGADGAFVSPCEWDPSGDEPSVSWVPVWLITNKQNAEV